MAVVPPQVKGLITRLNRWARGNSPSSVATRLTLAAAGTATAAVVATPSAAKLGEEIHLGAIGVASTTHRLATENPASDREAQLLGFDNGADLNDKVLALGEDVATAVVDSRTVEFGGKVVDAVSDGLGDVVQPARSSEFAQDLASSPLAEFRPAIDLGVVEDRIIDPLLQGSGRVAGALSALRYADIDKDVAETRVLMDLRNQRTARVDEIVAHYVSKPDRELEGVVAFAQEQPSGLLLMAAIESARGNEDEAGKHARAFMDKSLGADLNSRIDWAIAEVAYTSLSKSASIESSAPGIHWTVQSIQAQDSGRQQGPTLD